MIKKHFTWLANYIANEAIYFTATGFKNLPIYPMAIKFCEEFGADFDLDKFNSYIEKKINKK